MKTMTISGKRYRLEPRSHDNLVVVSGPGVLFQCCLLPAGVTLESADLRERVIAAIEEYRRCKQEASDMIRQRVRDE